MNEDELNEEESNEDESKTQIPIQRFLNKHKWLIILPILISAGYFYLAGYDAPVSGSYQNLFITSTENATNEELQKEITDYSNQFRSVYFYQGIIQKYDLFSEERKRGADEGKLAERLLSRITVSSSDKNLEEGVSVNIQGLVWNEQPEKVGLVIREIIARFEQQPNFQVVSKYVISPYDGRRGHSSKLPLLGLIMLGSLISMILIFLWEIASLFYTRRQSLILSFLNKHKYRIVPPILLITGYYGYGAYYNHFGVSFEGVFFINAQNKTNEQLGKEITDLSNQIKNIEFFRGLVEKYDLFSEERKQGKDDGVLAQRLFRSTAIRVDDDNIEKGVQVVIDGYIRNIEHEKAGFVTREIISRFEQHSNFQVIWKSIYPAEDIKADRYVILERGAILGVICAILLIFVWQIPYMFYSPKTQKFVFEPLKADWQDELLIAKSRNQTFKAVWINILYSFAFLSALVQESPIGNLFKFASEKI